MNENPYIEKIESLVTGAVDELLVEKEDFFLFREVWLNHPKKSQIVGEASLGGKVTYRIVTTEEWE